MPKMTTSAHDNDWIRLFESGTLLEFQDHFQQRLIDNKASKNNNDDGAIPNHLLHLACQYGADPSIVQEMVALLPHQVVDRDEHGSIPLHYVCKRRSFSALAVLHILLQAAPDTILLRISASCGTIGGDSDAHAIIQRSDDGALPSILAHNASAPPTVVQYLLRRQIEAHGGLIVSHADLSLLQWNEQTFIEYVAAALQQTARHPDTSNIIHRIFLEECRFSYASWQLLQQTLNNLPVGYLQELKLRHLHIWHPSYTLSPPQSQQRQRTANQNHHANHHDRSNDSQQQQQQQQRELVAADVAFWQHMVNVHRFTLVALELPHLYALTTASVNCMAQFLARQDFPVLEVLDVRSSDAIGGSSRHRYDDDVTSTSESEQKQEEIHVENFVAGVISPKSSLKSLAIERLTASDLKLLLAGLQHNRSVVFFHIGEVIAETMMTNDDEGDDEQGSASSVSPVPDWATLRQALSKTLQQNTALERVLGPRPLIHCPQVQLYLQLNREYHRRDIGHWSPTLVAHVLAKAKEDTIRLLQDDDNDNGNDDSSSYFPTHEPLASDHRDPRSTMFYILQSRPDILISKQ